MQLAGRHPAAAQRGRPAPQIVGRPSKAEDLGTSDGRAPMAGGGGKVASASPPSSTISCAGTTLSTPTNAPSLILQVVCQMNIVLLDLLCSQSSHHTRGNKRISRKTGERGRGGKPIFFAKSTVLELHHATSCFVHMQYYMT